MKKLLIISALILSVVSCKADSASYIQNDTFWYTTDGKPIYSQGGGIFRFADPETGEEHYYWYGVHYSGAEEYLKSPVKKNSNTGFVAVTCYKSDDLINWTFVNNVLTYSEINKHQYPYWVGRLGVAYVEEAKKYAIVVQLNSSVLFATCDTPTGNFTWHNNIDMTSMIGTPNTGDQTVFTDDDGKSYLVYSYGKGRSRIYISHIGLKDGLITLLDCNQIYKGSGREGNCMFKYKNKYYVCASDLYGWNASNVYYLEASDIYGPYTPTNSMKKMTAAAADYGHVTQTGFFYTVKGTEEETVIYCGDRWADFAGNGIGYNQWCPIDFDNGSPRFNSLSHWTIDVETGKWSVGPENNYVKNGSFDADRVNIPSGNKPVQSDLTGWTTVISKGNKVAVGSAASPVLNASNSTSDRAVVTGNKCLNIYDSVDFERKIYQKIQSTSRVPLEDGIYKLSAKAKGSGTFSKMQMYAKSGASDFAADIDVSDGKWHDAVIDSVKISDGVVELGFYAAGAANSWCRVDDVQLIRLSSDSEAASVKEFSSGTPLKTEYYSLDGKKFQATIKVL